MRNRLLQPSIVGLTVLALAACGEETTQPNTAEDQPTVPQLAVASNTWLTRRDMPLDLVSRSRPLCQTRKASPFSTSLGAAKQERLLAPKANGRGAGVQRCHQHLELVQERHARCPV